MTRKSLWLETSAYLDYFDKDDNSALQFAAREGHVDVAKVFEASKGDAKTRNTRD